MGYCNCLRIFTKLEIYCQSSGYRLTVYELTICTSTKLLNLEEKVKQNQTAKPVVISWKLEIGHWTLFGHSKKACKDFLEWR
jgi:hypothetical protein